MTPTDLIFTLCFEADISIAELANRIGVHRNTLAQIANANRLPGDRTMKALERYMAERAERKQRMQEMGLSVLTGKKEATPRKDGP